MTTNSEGALGGVRVVEMVDEPVEYCGRLLAGLGAEVIKLEPTGGAPSRAEGPYAELPMSALVLHIHREAIHHLAEVLLLRDLYRASFAGAR